MSAARRTIDHEEIKKWVTQHGGHAATVKRTHTKKDPGLLRIDFPGYSGEDTLEEIPWEDWFEKFEEQGLAFLYQPDTRFNKLVRRDSEEERPNERHRASH
jgi:hypothetical protein